MPSRPYLQLGLSHNVSYTYDPNAAQGNHITSVTVNGKPLDLKREYRIGSFSFLLQGGDNFRAFAAGKDTKDTGLVDRDAWIDYISKNSPLKPRYDRRAVAVTGIPADGKVTAGTSFDLQFSKLTLTSLGVPAETKLVATIDGTEVGSAAVKDGDTATLQVAVPAGLPAGAATFTVKAVTNGTTVTLPLTVAAGTSTEPQPGKPGQTEQPGQTKPGTGDERHDGANNAAGNGGNAGAVEQLSQTGAPVVAVVVAMMALLAAGLTAGPHVEASRSHTLTGQLNWPQSSAWWDAPQRVPPATRIFYARSETGGGRQHTKPPSDSLREPAPTSRSKTTHLPMTTQDRGRSPWHPLRSSPHACPRP